MHDTLPAPQSPQTHEPDASPETHQDPAELIMHLPKLGTFKVAFIGLLFLGLLAGLFALGYYPDQERHKELLADAQTSRGDILTVNAARPKRSAGAIETTLPADVHPMQQTSIYPRASGYLKKLLVDIGDRVEAGQLLAEIDSPEVDAQLEQAKAAVDQAQAGLDRAISNLAYVQLTYDRYVEYAKSGNVTAQQLDEQKSLLSQAIAGLAQAKAGLAVSKADVIRLTTLQGFEKISAPFHGVVTARNYDLGALLSPTSSGAAKEIFRIEENDTLRVFVNVPQKHATQIKVGQTADLTVANYPGRTFAGKVARSTASVDPATRTLRFEVHVANPDGKLFAGMYGQVTFRVELEQPPLLLPAGALIFNAEGLRVAMVADGAVHFQKVVLGRDFGNEVEVVSGLKGSELIITNPGDQLAEGLPVRLADNGSEDARLPRVATTPAAAR
ncbi:MAG: efflux RND transporter periplasmic adaptor subunit [Tepidisphaerales bacterium]